MDLAAYGIGFMVLANGATMITVLFAALRLSGEFGVQKEKISNNERRITVNEKRLHEVEKAI